MRRGGAAAKDADLSCCCCCCLFLHRTLARTLRAWMEPKRCFCCCLSGCWLPERAAEHWTTPAAAPPTPAAAADTHALLPPVVAFTCCLQMVKLKAFSKFENTTEALAAATALVDSKLSKGGHSLLRCSWQQQQQQLHWQRCCFVLPAEHHFASAQQLRHCATSTASQSSFSCCVAAVQRTSAMSHVCKRTHTFPLPLYCLPHHPIIRPEEVP